ncbi:MAG: hypothetical protein LBV18_04215 [Alistipes sp.]|jgi:FtsH-binding integral membrane protein|nr:hypothetical protein [Alistipes sp.]
MKTTIKIIASLAALYLGHVCFEYVYSWFGVAVYAVTLTYIINQITKFLKNENE